MAQPIQKFFNACSTGKADLVREFLGRGVDPESRDRNNLTALIWAGRKGHIPVAAELLAHGASINAGDNRGRTALYHAVMYKRYDFVMYLAERNANVNVVDTHGWSPLDFSLASRYDRMVTLLTSLGATSARHEA